jgi:hypothetical protein
MLSPSPRCQWLALLKLCIWIVIRTRSHCHFSCGVGISWWTHDCIITSFYPCVFQDLTLGSSHQQQHPIFFPWLSCYILKGLDIKPVFVWGNQKCEQTCIRRPLNPNKELVLKNMSMVFNEISPRFRPISMNDILLIDDCPFKCVGNTPSSYIIPQLFNSEKDD